MDSKILLDSSQGELEILDFTVKDVQYAINVAKVQEVIKAKHVTPSPMSPRGVRGMCLIRDDIYTVIDLREILYGEKTEITDDIFFILSNFNKQFNAFIVDKLDSIKRIAWSEMLKPSEILNSSDEVNIVGIINYKNDLISILDFEKIISDINPALGLKTDDVDIPDEDLAAKRAEHTILIADDSKMINKLLTDTIAKAGYHTISVEDGKQSLDLVLSTDKISLLVSDVEMPQMDGLESSRLIKEKKPDFSILIFSSLVNDALERKVEDLKLDGMITKPEIGELVSHIDKLLLGR